MTSVENSTKCRKLLTDGLKSLTSKFGLNDSSLEGIPPPTYAAGQTLKTVLQNVPLSKQNKKPKQSKKNPAVN